MHTFEPTMVKQTNIFLAQLLKSSRNSSPVDMTDKTRRLGMDIAGLLGFGYDLGLQVNDENEFMLTMLDMMTPKISSGKIREKYLGMMENIVTTRMSEGKHARHDLYSIVADALDAEYGGLRQSELWAEANFFLTAAGETTKTTMSALFFYLSRNPECYMKLAHEIRSTFSSGSEIGGISLATCHYLRACIDETLRMSPPASGVLWRERAGDDKDDRPLVIDGHVIPAGTVFGMSIYSLHHNEDCFPDSFLFSPERWLDQSASNAGKKSREAFAAFSIGPRACAGKSMAYLEMSLVLAKTLWYFDFEAAPGHLAARIWPSNLAEVLWKI
ncbi:hypothetical protein ABKA04_007176 [Annulohypoxylon sp. FPYF3050]